MRHQMDSLPVRVISLIDRENLKKLISWKNLKPVLFIVVVLILTAISAYPQRKFGGRVVEVVDGRTCVIELGNGKVTVVLEYIEIPEPEQPLYATVKEHLAALVLNKQVEFLPRGVMPDRTVGQLTLKGVDVGQQMLRDGAAWYAVPEQESQAESDSTLYRDNEQQAKIEKRGVWSLPDLKPAWEYRAEQEAIKEREQKEAFERMKIASYSPNRRVTARPTSTRQVASPQAEMWADVGEVSSQYDQPLGLGGLRGGFDPASKVGHISTPSIYLDLPKAELLRKMESRVFYFYKGDKTNIEDSVYVIGFLSIAKEYKFAKSNSLTLVADGQKLPVGRARRFFRQWDSVYGELLLYKVTRAQLMKLAKARTISIQLGSYTGGISDESLTFINNLLSAS
ncbi:MAG: thermonuclease family protein [Acidobacteria bacterium]|nr:thermonuclease family protein [Acidobacteriota bacterium]